MPASYSCLFVMQYIASTGSTQSLSCHTASGDNCTSSICPNTVVNYTCTITNGTAGGYTDWILPNGTCPTNTYTNKIRLTQYVSAQCAPLGTSTCGPYTAFSIQPSNFRLCLSSILTVNVTAAMDGSTVTCSNTDQLSDITTALSYAAINVTGKYAIKIQCKHSKKTTVVTDHEVLNRLASLHVTVLPFIAAYTAFSIQSSNFRQCLSSILTVNIIAASTVTCNNTNLFNTSITTVVSLATICVIGNAYNKTPHILQNYQSNGMMPCNAHKHTRQGSTGHRQGTAHYIIQVLDASSPSVPPGPSRITAWAPPLTSPPDQLAVTWTPPTTGGIPTSYNVAINDSSPVVVIADNGSPVYTHVFTGLISDTLYAVSVVAINCAGTSNVTSQKRLTG